MDMTKRSAEPMIPEKIRRVTAVPTPSSLTNFQRVRFAASPLLVLIRLAPTSLIERPGRSTIIMIEYGSKFRKCWQRIHHIGCVGACHIVNKRPGLLQQGRTWFRVATRGQNDVVLRKRRTQNLLAGKQQHGLHH